MRLVVALIFSLNILLHAQNLVPNPGFEEYTRCPQDYSQYGQAMPIPNWFSAGTGTPDYFNECSKGESKASFNWAGRCDDFSGKGYAGIITCMENRPYREYLSVELLQPLDSGVTYLVQFSFRLSSYSKISTGNIGLALTDNRISVKHDKVISLVPVLVAMKDSAIVKNTGKWQVAYMDYTAHGGERFLTIGNFSEHNPSYRIRHGGNHQFMLKYASYYLFDDVIVQPQVEFVPEIPITIEDENPFESDSLIVLKNVQFAYNSSVLNKISEAELNRVLGFMIDNPETRIEIYGHTDDQGTDEYNIQLSYRRAKSALDYLEKNGIDKIRMQCFGYGKSMPLIDSTDETARGINRRVEVKLVK